jgi:hypothetical protein
MAFKPIIVEKEIKGKVYKAQFNGASMLFRFQDETEGKSLAARDFLLKYVLVDPQISPEDFDEYIGTDIDLMNELIDFLGAVVRCDSEYFPDTNKSGNASKG